MVVRMEFNSGNRRAGTRKYISRAVSRVHREINHLKHKNDEFKKRLETLQKKNQRLRKKSQISSPKTPRSQTERDMREAQLTPNRGKKVRKQLLLGNALLAELQEARKIAVSSISKNQVLRAITSEKILQRYKGTEVAERKKNWFE